MSDHVVDEFGGEVQLIGNRESSSLQRCGPTQYKWVTIFWLAVLHLGVLVLSTGGFTPVIVIYLVGLVIALVALILG